jgi:hypothetical protein
MALLLELAFPVIISIWFPLPTPLQFIWESCCFGARQVCQVKESLMDSHLTCCNLELCYSVVALRKWSAIVVPEGLYFGSTRMPYVQRSHFATLEER